jgi:hypothetical protein
MRIVDDRGVVVSKGSAGPLQKLRLRPAADAHYRAPIGIGGVAGAHSQAAAEGEVFRGTKYFLEVLASPDVAPDTPYPIEISVDPDSEGDGMDDDFEEAHDLDPQRDDAHEDPDKDGSTNIEEYEAGTDPRDPDSVPNACGFDLDGDGDVDGGDFNAFALGLGGSYTATDLETFALELGRNDCHIPSR